MLCFACIYTISANIVAQPLPTVLVDPATRIQISEMREVVGQVISQEGGIISTEIGGQIEKVVVDIGDRIDAGAEIAELDSERLQLDLKLAEAQANTAKANEASAKLALDLAKLNLQRQESLRGSAAFSRALYEDLQNAEAHAMSELSAAQAETVQRLVDLEVAKLNVSDSVIRAPFPGIVTQKLVNPGAYVSPGSGIISLINYNENEITFNVPREQVTAIRTTETFEVLGNDNHWYQAYYKSVLLTENAASRTVTVILTPSDELLANIINNQSITIKIPTSAAQSAVTVHKDAIINRGDKYMVFVVENGIAKMHMVEIGLANKDRVQVINGLKEGDLAIIRGNERLRPDQPINYETVKQ